MDTVYNNALRVLAAAGYHVVCFSSTFRLLRAGEWTAGFGDKVRRKSFLSAPLTLKEIENTNKFWIRSVQAKALQHDIRAVRKKELEPGLLRRNFLCERGPLL
ncbi:hypothetical protein HPB48_014587 [Haemaphysalis longicornis]|uniref:Uncharacterized protein n=1 Tax=Haemaphysalis longicornis TaxID=44386 RepID=A0A9J6FND3_HAELO|nr:hypothetical protein HPB48_014587 [Haemaphysalis longicornis]